MESTFLDNNLYLMDVLQIELSHEFQTLSENVMKKLHSYFEKTYKKLLYDDFVNSNDYYIQQIKMSIEIFQTAKYLDITKYGQTLQNFIISIEKPIMLAAQNKMVRSSIINLRSFLIKNKQQFSLINQLESLENKAKENNDYLLLLEKLCVLLKSVLDAGEMKSNKKLKLYGSIAKFLSEERFLLERKVLSKQNKINYVNTEIRSLIHDILPEEEDLNGNKWRNQNLIRSNSQNEGIEDRNNNLIFNLENNKEESEVNRTQIPQTNKNCCYTNEPEDPKKYKLLSSNAHSEITSVNNVESNTNSPIFFVRNKQSDKDVTINSNGMVNYKKGHNFEENSSTITKIFYHPLHSKPTKMSYGDLYSPIEFNEDIFINNAIVDCKESIKLLPEEPVVERNSILENEKKLELENPLRSSQSKDFGPYPLSPTETARSNFYKRNRKVSFVNVTKLENTNIYPIFSSQNSTIKLPANFMTNDPDLKLLCDLINEPVDSPGWKKVMHDKIVTIHKKNLEGVPQILIKTEAHLDGFTKEEVFEAISNVNIRMQWDTVFSEFKIVETNDEEQWEVLYMSIKSPSVFVQNRDFVQKRKIWRDFPNSDSVIIHFKSVDHKLCPETKKFIRADTTISGYYIQTVTTNPPKTLVSIVAQNDIKGIIPNWIVNSVSQKAPKTWVNNLMKGCEKVRANKK